MYSTILIQKMRALFSAVELKARIAHVNMRATFTLSYNWQWGGDSSDEGASVINSRAINEWTFNG